MKEGARASQWSGGSEGGELEKSKRRLIQSVVRVSRKKAG
jgi:hypothetical protein